MSKEGVSIIICCYNSSSRIGETLRHLQNIKANGIEWEVILVDNASDDDTSDFSRRVWELNPVTKLRVVSQPIKGLMNARIKGAESASYDIFSFIDDDNWVEADWVLKVNTIIRNDSVIAACGGSAEAVFEGNPPTWFSEFSRSYATGLQQNESGFVKPEKGYLWGAGLSVRKKAWDELFHSGFSSLLPGRSGKALTAGEDSELCLSWILRGWKLWYEESLKLKHYIPSSRLQLDYLVRMYEGFGKAEVVLSVYRGLISLKTKKFNSWLFQCIVSIEKLIKTGWNYFFSNSTTRLRNRILWRHQRAFVIELLFNRKKYLFARDTINKYFTKPVKLTGQTASAIR